MFLQLLFAKICIRKKNVTLYMMSSQTSKSSSNYLINFMGNKRLENLLVTAEIL